MRLAVISAAFAVVAALPAMAQDRIPSHCIALAETAPQVRLIRAAWTDPVAEETVRLSFIDHAMYLLQTHGGLSVVTDYRGFIGGAGPTPTVVTMNNAHSSHNTRDPDPAIRHVLRGWMPDGSAADHYLDLEEMLVRNVPTATRGWDGDRPFGNSIFIFEVAGLCIGHLGHLHHEPTPEQYALIGRLDVVMAAVDGGLTVDTPTMVRILQRFRSSLILPMHWFGEQTLDRFLTSMSPDFEIVRPGKSEVTVSLSSLPKRPTIMVLEPAFLR